MTTMEPIFVARSYEDLRQGLIMRRKQLGIPQIQLDEIAGLPGGYVGKIEGGRRVKDLGPLSLTLLLGALGGELWFVERAASTISATEGDKFLSFKRFCRLRAQKGGRIRRARLSDFRRRQSALKAGRANGAKWRAIKAAKAAKAKREKRRPIITVVGPCGVAPSSGASDRRPTPRDSRAGQPHVG